MAIYERRLGPGLDAWRTRLDALLQRAPNDRRLLSERASAIGSIDLVGDQQAWVERADALAGGAPHAWSALAFTHFARNDYASMEHALARSLARQPTSFAYELKLMLLVWGWGDLEAARAWLAQTPSSLLQEDRIAFLAFHVEQWSRRGDAAPAILRRVPRDFLEDSNLFVSKGYLMGEALFVAGKTRAAEIEWQAALQAVDQRITGEPNSGRLLRCKAKLLARLNRVAEAEKYFVAATELGEVGSARTGVLRMAEQWALLGRNEEAVTEAEQRLVRGGNRWPMILNDLRFEPVFDRLRRDPRFAALVTKGEDWLAELRRAPRSGGATPATAESAPQKSEDRGQGIGQAISKTDQKSVAVLAFANLSDDKSTEYFSDGISEELINLLAKMPGLKVTARTSAFHFKGKDTPIPEIAQKLGVAHVVEGSVRKAGDRVRITAQLIKAGDGFHVWSETFTRELKDIFAVQDEIAGKIAQALSLRLAVTVASATTKNLEAYTHYLRARSALAQRGAESLAQARQEFEEALKLDENFVPARTGLARTLLLTPFFSTLTNDVRRQLVESAERQARHVIERQPENAEAWSTLAMINTFHLWRWREAGEAIERALAIAPNDPEVANFAGDIFRVTGDFARMLAMEQRAVELNPLHAINHNDLAWARFVMGDYETAVQHAKDCITLAPHIPNSYHVLVRSLGALHRFEEIREFLKIARERVTEPTTHPLALAVHAAIVEGRRDEALRLQMQLEPYAGKGEYSSAHLGYDYLLLGHPDKALHWLQRAYATRDWALVDTILDFRPVAADPTTRVILEKPELRELMEIRARNAAAAHPKR